MPNIRMIFWDYGRVLFDHHTDVFVEELARLSQSRLKPYEVYAKINGQGTIRRYDAGEITTSEFMNEMRTLLGFEDLDGFIALWHRILRPNRLVWKAVTALSRNGYSQGVISNTNELQAEYIEKVLACGAITQFRPRIYSYLERFSKPDSMIYLVSLVRARVEHEWDRILLPEECVFIDDLVENVESARECGWHAIHHNPGFVYATIAKLAELGVRI